MNPSSRRHTTLQIVSDQADDLPDTAQESIEAALGHLQIQTNALCAELAQKSGDQSAERLLQCLVSISAIALSAAASHVIPELEKEEA